MSQWKFTSILPQSQLSTSTCKYYVISPETVYHLQNAFHNYKPYIIDMDETKFSCSMQFNQRPTRLAVQTRLLEFGIYNLYVEGIFNATPITHPNSNVLINDPIPHSEGNSSSPPKKFCGQPTIGKTCTSTNTSRPLVSVVKLEPGAITPTRSNEYSHVFNILSPANYFINAKSTYTIELGYALVPPPGYCLKIVSALQFTQIYQNFHTSISTRQPLSLTLFNNTNSAYEISLKETIAILTCHIETPCDLQVIETDISLPQLATFSPPLLSPQRPIQPVHPLPSNSMNSAATE